MTEGVILLLSAGPVAGLGLLLPVTVLTHEAGVPHNWLRQEVGSQRSCVSMPT